VSTTVARPCVVFDIDDTLYLERDYVRSGFEAVGGYLEATWGVAGCGQRAWELFLQGHRHSTFDTVLAEADLPGQVVSDLVELYRQHAPTIQPCADAAHAITRLRPTGPLAVISDGPLSSQRAKADALGVDRWSDLTVLTATLGEGRGKPAPDAFELVERQFPDAPGYAYIGDNPAKDFLAPRRLGWRTVRLRRAGSLHEQVRSGPDVDVEITDLDDIEEALGGPVRSGRGRSGRETATPQPGETGGTRR
jgi:putative hydrolase of the HAD superfamily